MNRSFRITNIGAQYKGLQYARGCCFRLSWFQLGAGGVDATGLPYTVDATRTSLALPVTPLLSIATYGALSVPEPRRALLDVVLDAETGNGLFSQLGIFGEIIYADEPQDVSLIGTRFLYGLLNFTEVSKLVGETRRLTFSLNTAL